jgi:hypothetical protein
MLACGAITSAPAQVSVGIGVNLPGVSIGINIPSYPQLVRVPNYPVYYAPGLNANFFFYDGLYWIYESDNWYSSSWYNGPWAVVEPLYVPVYVLRVPVRYYREPPPYFRGWRPDAPPRWGDHWGRDWEQRHSGWDRWNRNAAPPPAPLPVYQRQYSGSRYPQQVDQQRTLQSQNYRYQPRDAVVRERFQQITAPPGRPAAPQREAREPREPQRPQAQAAPQRAEVPPPPSSRGRDEVQRAPNRPAERPEQAHPAPRMEQPQPSRPVQERPQPPVAQPQRGPEPDAQGAQERPGRGQGQGHERGRGEGRGNDKKD